MEKVRWYLQWHITDNCNNDCIHCYNKGKRKTDEPTVAQFKEVLADFLEACNEMGAYPHIALIGGDPLLHPNFKEFVNILKDVPNLILQIAGNPETLTNEMIRFLLPHIANFQVSLDGNRIIHDKFRYKGSFAATIDCLQRASNMGMKMNVMSTISELNVHSIGEMINIACSAGADKWTFARYVPELGEKNNLTPKMMRVMMSKVLSVHNFLDKEISKKESFWNCFSPVEKNKDCKLISGCGLGTLSMSILPDNTIMGCRRHAGSVLGKWEKKGDFIDKLLFHPILIKFRKVEKIKRCKDCVYLYSCRGCRAISYASSNGQYFETDPSCSFFKSKE